MFRGFVSILYYNVKFLLNNVKKMSFVSVSDFKYFVHK